MTTDDITAVQRPANTNRDGLLADLRVTGDCLAMKVDMIAGLQLRLDRLLVANCVTGSEKDVRDLEVANVRRQLEAARSWRACVEPLAVAVARVTP